MAIVINGDGSISGISAGGLPTGSVTADTLATNSVDSAELVSGAIDAGHLASGVGGTWNLIGTSEASASASLTVTGLDSTYDTYAIVISDLLPATDNTTLGVRVGDSGGVDSGASDYAHHCCIGNEAVTTYSGQASTGDTEIQLANGIGGATGEGVGALLYLHRPGDGTTFPMISGTYVNTNSVTNCGGGQVTGMRQAVITLDRIQVIFASGNITSGRLSVYGIAHT